MATTPSGGTDLLGGTTPSTAAVQTASGGSFPQTDPNQSLPQPPIDASTGQPMTAAKFFSDYNIASTEQATYLTNGQLNGWASAYINYIQLSPIERQQLQLEMASAGLLTDAQATGEQSSVSDTAFKALIGDSQANGVSPTTYLTTIAAGGTTGAQEAILAETTGAEKELTNPAPETVDLTNPSTARAAIQNAFTQTLGYAATDAQVAQFTAALQGQDYTNAAEGNDATKAQAEQELASAKAQTSALDALGQDGVNSFITALRSAINGGGAPGAGTNTGPISGTEGGVAAQPGAPGLTLGGPGGTPGQSATQTEPTGAYHVPQISTGLNPTPPPGSGPAGNIPLIAGLVNGPEPEQPGGPVVYTTHTGEKVTYSHAATPPVAGQPGGAVHGGLYALTPKDWALARQQLPNLQLPDTPGAATPADQEAAAKAVALHLYQQYNGSWSDVAMAMAGGTPGTASGKAEGTNTQMAVFANNIVTSINNALMQVQNQAGTTPTMTVKETTPDVNAEANAAAKASDPIGYAAANYSSWGSELDKILYGSPQTYLSATSDTFTGPVAPPATPGGPSAPTS